MNTDILAHIVLCTFYILEIYRHRVLPRFSVIHIAYPVGCQVCSAILVLWYLVLPAYSFSLSCTDIARPIIPLIQAYRLLHIEKGLILEGQWLEGSSQVYSAE